MRNYPFVIATWAAAALIGSISDASAQVLSGTRSSAFTYDAETALLSSESVEPSNPALCVSTAYAYDAYGNRTSSTTQNCAGASGLALFDSRPSSGSFASYSVTVNSVAVTVPAGVFNRVATNALGQSETRTADPRFGELVSLTGPNALTTTWQLDDFGRKTLEIRADGTRTQVWYCLISGRVTDVSSNSAGCSGFTVADAPANAVRFEHSLPTSSSGAAIGAYARVYFDRAGRKLRSVTEGFDSSLVVQDTDYDAWGNVSVATQPYFLSRGSSTVAGSNDYGMTRTTYDALGRPTDVFVADPQGQAGVQTFGSRGSTTAAKSSVSYSGLATTFTDALGRTRTEERSLDGKLIRATDALGAQIAYQHDAFDNLVRTKDALGNQIVAAFDIRGRKTSLDDPDAGVSVYCYDALGQLKAQQTSKMRGSHAVGACPSISGAGTVATSVAGWTTLAYDKLGRQTSRVEPEYSTTWTYDSCTKGVGKLCSSSTSNGVTRQYVYDALGRSVSARTDISAGPSYASAVSYDATTGRVSNQTYPSGLQLSFQYTAKGYLDSVSSVTALSGVSLPAGFLWKANAVNAWGRAETQTRGNNVIDRAEFDARTGRVSRLYAGPSSATASVIDHRYGWNSLGQLTSRIDALGDVQGAAASGGTAMQVSDTFVYDELGRLKSNSVSGGVSGGSAPVVVTRSVQFQYNALGLMLSNSEVGNYTYATQGVANGRPHAVQSVAGTVNTSYGYDLSGNVVSATGSKYSALTLTSFNLPSNATGVAGASGTPSYAWQYDESHQRIKETRTNSTGSRTTWFMHPDNIGGLGFEREEAPGGVSNRHYISAGGQTIGVVVTGGALPTLTAGAMAPTNLASISVVKLEFWHKDHIGSLIATTSPTAAVTARYAYDAFGKRRQMRGSYDAFGTLVIDWVPNAPGSTGGTDRGFTGHEHLDDIGIVHMNGRLFDPTIARFMQADPLIQDPTNLQNFDRYQYCYNNPGSCTDPSGQSALDGMFREGINSFKYISPLGYYALRAGARNPTLYQIGAIGIGAASAYWCGWFGPAAIAGCTAVGQATWSGFAGNSFNQSMKTGTIAGATAFAMYYVGNLTTTNGVVTNPAGNIAGHALVGCASSAASGGSCRDGAVSGAIGAAFSVSEFYVKDNMVIATIQHAAVGGLSSKLTGGDFWVGARTAAFGYLFNALQHTAGDGPNGRDPYDRHQEGVRSQADLLRSQGFEVLGFEVPATVDGLDYGRRYDIVVRDDQGRIFGVEVKTSLTGVFRLDPKQVEFDALAVEKGALTLTTPVIRGVMYRGECFGCGPDAIFRSWKLTDKLIEKGVPFYPAKPPKP